MYSSIKCAWSLCETHWSHISHLRWARLTGFFSELRWTSRPECVCNERQVLWQALISPDFWPCGGEADTREYTPTLLTTPPTCVCVCEQCVISGNGDNGWVQVQFSQTHVYIYFKMWLNSDMKCELNQFLRDHCQKFTLIWICSTNLMISLCILLKTNITHCNQKWMLI